MDASAAVLQIFRNILTIKQEDDQLRVIDLQVGSQVHSKVPGNLRTELWLSCLHRKGVGSGYASQYQAMLYKGVSEEAAYDIEKDVGRTFPGLAKFGTIEGKQSLERVLRAYAAFDTEVNYCQGMNFLAALLLIWLPREADAFGALVLVMKDRGLRELYKTDMTMLQARLWQLGKIMPRHLARHMEHYCAIPVLYASSWLLTAFASDFPIFFSSRVMDIILADRYLEAMMKVVVGILKACEKRLLAMTDMEKMVDFLRGEVPRWPHDKLQELLTEALAAEWTPEQAAVLERTEGAESVVDAVQRVASATPQAEDDVDEADQEAVSPAKSEPKLASFSWASKLSAASSTASSAGQPNLLQSLTGSISGFGASLPSYYDAAKQMTSSSLSPLGDLLGLFDSPKTSPEPAAAPSSSRANNPSPSSTLRAEIPIELGSAAAAESGTGISAGRTGEAGRAQSGLRGKQEGSQRSSEACQGPRVSGGSGRGSLKLASSSSWGPFHESEDTEVPGQVAVGGRPEPDQATPRQRPNLAAARSGDAEELRWAAPRRGTGSLPASPFQQPPRPPLFDSPHVATAGAESGEHRGELAEVECCAGRHLNDGSAGDLARGEAAGSGTHRPSRSDVDSVASWGSFREPDQADASGHHECHPLGQPPPNDFLIRLSSTPSGHRSQHSDTGGDEAAVAAPDQAQQQQNKTDTEDAKMHLVQLDDDGCWNGCMPGRPDLISTGELSSAGEMGEDPFSHMALTEPLSQGQMQRGDGTVRPKTDVSDWENSQISTFAAASSGSKDSSHVPMKKSSSAHQR